MTAAEQPLGPRRFDFGALTDDDFELLCYLVVLLEFPEAIRLRPPDLGADSGLPAASGRDYARCWQAKRFTGHIHWGKCVASLNSAVLNYRMPHYTFCFARDLTGGQEHQFKRRLVGLHSGVTVDHWGASRLLSGLVTSAEGERIANYFYGDPTTNAAAVIQALRAGGPLETGADAGERLRAVAEWLASHDPFFSYPTHTRETGLAGPGLTPGAVIAVEEIGPDITSRIEAVPRNAAAIDEYGPGGALMFERTEEGKRALDAFQRAIDTGEQVTISEGVSLRFDRLPPLLQPMVPEEPLEGLEITIGPSDLGAPRRWPALLAARSDAGTSQIEIDLEPVQPPPGFDAALQGSRGGLTATLLFQRAPKPGVMFKFDFSYDSTLPVADQLAAVATLLAIHGKGTLEVHATDGSRPEPLVLDLDGGELPPFVTLLHRFLADVRVIEEWVGTTLSLPRSISGEEMTAAAETAYILRRGESRMDFDQMTLELDAERYEPFKAGVPGPIRAVIPLAVRLFGRMLGLGYLVGDLPASDVKVADVTTVAGAVPPAWLVRLEPASEAASHPTFRLEREQPEPNATPAVTP